MSAQADSALTNDSSSVENTCEPLSIARMIRQHHGSLLSFLRRRLRVAEDADDVAHICELPSAEREIEARQDVASLYQAIAELPPKCQQVFLLSRVRKMTYPEIARHCDISLEAVEKHISRALAICAQKVGGRARGTS
jgi:RNA polymerase sigma factor (sigma-70 family)